MKKLAFTLAEVLITLAIIGVVAALTMPVLINNWQEKVLLTKIRKSTAEIANAVDIFLTEEGKNKLYLTSIYTKDSGLDDFITSKFNVIKTCEANESGCFYDGKYKSIDGKNSQTFSCSGKSYVLANSASICITLEDDENYINSINLIIDTNGAQKPNVGGKDMFEIYIDCVNGKVRGDSHSLSIGGLSTGLKIDRTKCSSSSLGHKCYTELLKNNFSTMKYKNEERTGLKSPDNNDNKNDIRDTDIANEML